MERYFLGLDTSAYTTSAAGMDTAGVLLFDERQLLTVEEGERGLRQSEGVFQHINNLPRVLARVWQLTGGTPPAAVVYSEKPRPVADSYLPVFRAGSSIARSLAGVLGVPAVASTHQAGHLFAGIWSNHLLRRDVEDRLDKRQDQEFLAVHFSGGTSELARVRIRGNGELALELLGATTDLHAGQFVDRVGVRLGLPFPAGPHLERLAVTQGQGTSVRLRLPVAVKGLEISFSGPATAAMRAIAQGAQPENVARAVLDCVAETLIKWLRAANKMTQLRRCLLVGGVMSNSYIRHELLSTLGEEGFELFFAEPKYSTDNATGLAYYGYLLSRLGQL